ncbi:MAG: ferredoxin--NADP(+) reductase [Planctomycetota bacterium]
MHLQNYDTSTRYQAEVVSTERITPETTDEVREIRLEFTAADFGAGPGQCVGVIAPGSPEFGQQEHLRLYTLADMPETKGGRTRVTLCVRRCQYIDDYSGERYDGLCSNYLCDLSQGDEVTLTGPYGQVFPVPDEPGANLMLIGAGTGIAPFRGFLKQIFRGEPPFDGKVRLFHGARTGLDMLYRNSERDDLSLYYDRDTFEAIDALASRPHWSDDIDWSGAMESRASEISRLLDDVKTHVYVAGREQIAERLDEVFSRLLDSPTRWARRKAEMAAGGRWVEILY